MLLRNARAPFRLVSLSSEEKPREIHQAWCHYHLKYLYKQSGSFCHDRDVKIMNLTLTIDESSVPSYATLATINIWDKVGEGFFIICPIYRVLGNCGPKVIAYYSKN